MKNGVRYWQGEVTTCDLCKRDIGETFVDGPTRMGPWAKMCIHCVTVFWRKPMGQTYQKQSDGRWLKIKG